MLSHKDLLERNIHVDYDTGHITGIFDWADAKVSAFGISLNDLKTVLGVQTSTCWHYHPSHEHPRTRIWET